MPHRSFNSPPQGVRDSATHSLPPLIALPKAPAALGVSRSAIYRLAAEGRITLRKIGRSSFVETASFLQLVDTLPEAPIGGRDK